MHNQTLARLMLIFSQYLHKHPLFLSASSQEIQCVVGWEKARSECTLLICQRYVYSYRFVDATQPLRLGVDPISGTRFLAIFKHFANSVGTKVVRGISRCPESLCLQWGGNAANPSWGAETRRRRSRRGVRAEGIGSGADDAKVLAVFQEWARGGLCLDRATRNPVSSQSVRFFSCTDSGFSERSAGVAVQV